MRRILVIDDEQMICVNLKAYLEDEGYEVFTAESAEESLALLQKETIDLAIVDIRLPGMDGNAFMLEAVKIQPKIRFVIHTGSSEYEVPEELAALGIQECQVFLKPINDMQKLLDQIQQLTTQP